MVFENPGDCIDALTTSAASDDGDKVIEGEELRGVEMGHFEQIEMWCAAQEMV
jgi:hypothetical protein